MPSKKDKYWFSIIIKVIHFIMNLIVKNESEAENGKTEN